MGQADGGGGVSRFLLEELAADLGVQAVYLEKDWVLTEIIFALASGPFAEQLVLKGGQALRHIYGSVRLSKDADYVATRRVEFEQLHEAVRIRQPRITLPATPEGRTKYGFKVRPVSYRGVLAGQGSVELEVSFRGDLVLPVDLAPYVSPFRETFTVRVMALDEMVSEKLRALYQRGNPRDLYDLWFIFTTRQADVDVARVASLIPTKFDPDLVRGGWDRARLYDRIEAQQGDWRPTLSALVPDPPEFDEALVTVQRALRGLPR